METPQFAIGDIAIIVTSTESVFVGRECTVLSACRPRLVRYPNGQIGEEEGHEVEVQGMPTPSGVAGFLVHPRQLRKKQPPSDDRDVVRWADVPWQPAAVRA